MRRSPTRPLLAALLGLAALPAQAALTTGTLAVSALVVDTCLVAATPLAFGNLSGATTTTELAPAIVTVTCTAAKPSVTLTIDGGANPNGGVRRMAFSTSFVPYTIYSNSGRSSAVAIDGTLYSGLIAAVVPTALNIYGIVPAGSYAAGAYVDAATVTLTY